MRFYTRLLKRYDPYPEKNSDLKWFQKIIAKIAVTESFQTSHIVRDADLSVVIRRSTEFTCEVLLDIFRSLDSVLADFIITTIKQLEYITENRDYVVDFCAKNLPEIKARPQEGTYLMWLDCSACGLSDAELTALLEKAGIRFYAPYEDGTIIPEKKNIYAPFKVDWHQVPQYNPKTKQWDKRTMEWKETMVGVLGSEEAFQYQYGTAFSASDRCLVNRETLTKIRTKTVLFENRNDLNRWETQMNIETILIECGYLH